jgi:DNA-binding FadR family transcriptional regulator
VRKTAEVIADEIRNMILAGRLKEGDALPTEAETIAKFSVSRPSMREAFRILESENLISISRGSRGGARVHAPQVDLVARYAGFVLQSRNVPYSDAYEARLIVEPPGARLVAERRHGDAPAILRGKIDQERAARDGAGFGCAVADFHTTLMSLSGNETLILLSQVLNGIVARHQSLLARAGQKKSNERASQSSLNAAIRSQEKLVALIEARDGAGAEAHWRRHMENAGKIWLAGEAGAALVTWAG